MASRKTAKPRWRHSMGTTDYEKDERLQWLRFVLNPSLPLPMVSDWQGLLEFAERQAIAGVCEPTRFDAVRPSADTLYEWIGLAVQLKELNGLLNRLAAKLTGRLQEAGFRCCILKGQGNATMYPDAGLRTPGDIDVWVDADKEDLLAYVKNLFPDEEESFKHIKFPVFRETEVDMHYTPLKVYHPVYNRRLQAWIGEKKEQQMTHYVRLADTPSDVAVPTASFNAVYQMGHILIHIEDEGIGLRQMIDYYYVLRQLGGLPETEKAEIVDTWRRLGMKKLAAAVMWVEHSLLGLPEEFLLVAPCERTGRLLAADIMEGGNFGHHSSRQGYWKYGRNVKKCADAWHLLRLSACFPGEAFFRIISKAGTAGRILVKKIVKKK